MLKKIILIIGLLSLGLFAAQMKLLDQNAKDIVYQVPLKKFQKFICEAKLKDGTVIQFVSVKSMLQVYYHQKYFLDHKLMRSKIAAMYVQDYITGDVLNAKDALFVFGSRLVGPHGDDLIPLKDQNSAKLFELKYGGSRILPYSKMTVGLIKYLDM
ncbi:MAG: nitrous oxide reductase accessory protein NosL [Sulfurospirillaceae bacterium]|nr:nitrous oxide reductase accessory protein NosL [Sulfurospirillaceae bacterium]